MIHLPHQKYGTQTTYKILLEEYSFINDNEVRISHIKSRKPKHAVLLKRPLKANESQ